MTQWNESISVGILGSGFMGRTYAETLTKFVKDARLVGVACGSRASALAKDYQVNYYESYNKLIEQADIDAVFVATPHAQHAEQALAAARAGKHLLIEKPMARSVEECDAILAECKSRSLKCTIAFTQRPRICNAKTKELLDSGKMGRILQFRSYQMVPGGMPHLPKWQMESDNMGTLFGHAVHNFDNIRWLTGQEIRTVYAKCRSLDPHYATEGTSDVLMTLADDTVAYLFSSFQVPTPGFPRSQFAYRIICERGLLDVDAYGEARVSVDGSEWKTFARQEPIDWQGKGFLDPVRLESYGAHLQDFIHCIRENHEPSITGWDGRQALAAALAAYESNRTGKEIVLPV
ncbi:MAG: gfo/Idh/MocA family oxidoreductase [Candidatus Omnitrophota bacterium]|jgi:predicted dehydrogenase|nr:MAG: gfo/Idh/MocA family oxidoreductase [Candidatus Omnitrophota bacterium]